MTTNMFSTKLIVRYASKSAATATVRAVKRRSLLPTRAALSLTPTAVKRVKELVSAQPNCVSFPSTNYKMQQEIKNSSQDTITLNIFIFHFRWD